MPKPSQFEAALSAKRKELLALLKASVAAKAGAPGSAGSGEPNPFQKQAIANCMATITDKSKPARTRAEFLLLFINEVGYDLLDPVTALLERLDRQAELEKNFAELAKKVEESEQQEARPLQPELFLRSVELPSGPAHVLLTQLGPVIVPITPEFAEKLGPLRSGDYVLVDRGTGTVVARDGALSPVGEIVTVEQVPEEGSSQAIVKLRDEHATAYVSDDVIADPDFQPGARVVWDPARHFLHRIVDDRSDGSELLTPASELSGFGLDSLGAPHPVLDKLLRLVQRQVKHPDWARRMNVREKASYLFYGPTGTGKTCTIKVLVNLVADWLEKLTGTRETRVVFCDASDFYSPYFGEAEQKITSWFKKLSRVARREVVTKHGKKIRVPLIVVFEEIEGLVRQRGEFSASSHLFDRVLSLILNKMDEVKKDLEVPLLVISSTNKKSLLDTAGKRRFGQRETQFGMLGAGAAFAVLEKKIPADMEVRVAGGETKEEARARILKEVLYFLFGDQDDQVLARATLRDGKRLDVRRRDAVSGATLEGAVSQAIDDCLDRSEMAGQLLGLDAETLIRVLAEQYEGFASSLDQHNVLDHVPHLFDGLNSSHVTDVRPVQRPGPVSARYASSS